jgi:hypothetical protein
MAKLLYKDLGCMDYLAALELQEKLLELKQGESSNIRMSTRSAGAGTNPTFLPPGKCPCIGPAAAAM